MDDHFDIFVSEGMDSSLNDAFELDSIEGRKLLKKTCGTIDSNFLDESHCPLRIGKLKFKYFPCYVTMGCKQVRKITDHSIIQKPIMRLRTYTAMKMRTCLKT